MHVRNTHTRPILAPVVYPKLFELPWLDCRQMCRIHAPVETLKLYSAPCSLRRDDMQTLLHRRTCHVVFFMPGGNGSEGPSSSLSTLSIVAQIFGSGFAIWSMLSNCSQSPCAQSALSAFVCTLLLLWVRSWLVRPRAIARRLRRDPEPIVGVRAPEDVTFDAML